MSALARLQIVHESSELELQVRALRRAGLACGVIALVESSIGSAATYSRQRGLGEPRGQPEPRWRGACVGTKPMRIALVSTVAVSVPPRAYGGTELVIAALAKALTCMGHHVTVFGTGDSRPEAELHWHFASAHWPPDPWLELRHAAASWEAIRSAARPFDVVHVHEPSAVAFSKMTSIPTVLTLHYVGPQRHAVFFQGFPSVSCVAISRRQAELAPEVSVRHVVHHGLNVDQYEAGSGDGGWLAFVGRFAPEKGPDTAIDVAREVGWPLRMGGAPHEVDRAFFESDVKTRLADGGGLVHWCGEVSHAPKLQLLGGARATLFPIRWEEPFGLVMIESMLVGTPVVAFARGAAPEVVDEGVTGFLARDAAEMVDCVRRVHTLDRNRCRARARERWSSTRMAEEYLRVYEAACRAPT